ncbi:hypothetical protein AM1_B0163 (plasmid) [Acaryochloris marina MBIC11017]|uniref:Uncharacterized protein n=1 Tax=Acaryochloris marina (strain MBIC 11017) TaxID=329726 RepID=A8ZL59_ACAM1|nr:hypothetical protein AM1_B0163 [Acaryochloris marina MBIC11017]
MGLTMLIGTNPYHAESGNTRNTYLGKPEVTHMPAPLPTAFV